MLVVDLNIFSKLKKNVVLRAISGVLVIFDLRRITGRSLKVGTLTQMKLEQAYPLSEISYSS